MEFTIVQPVSLFFTSLSYFWLFVNVLMLPFPFPETSLQNNCLKVTDCSQILSKPSKCKNSSDLCFSHLFLRLLEFDIYWSLLFVCVSYPSILKHKPEGHCLSQQEGMEEILCWRNNYRKLTQPLRHLEESTEKNGMVPSQRRKWLVRRDGFQKINIKKCKNGCVSIQLKTILQL